MKLAEQLRHRVADGVGDVDRGRALRDHRLEHAAEEVEVASASRPRARTRRRRAGLRAKRTESFACSSTCSGVMRSFFSMCSGAGGDEGVDAPARSRPCSASTRALDVAVVGARTGAHTVESLIDVGDRLHRLEVAVATRPGSRPRSRRRACARAARAMRSFSSLRHRGARALLAVAHGGVEDDQIVPCSWTDPLAGYRRPACCSGQLGCYSDCGIGVFSARGAAAGPARGAPEEGKRQAWPVA